MDDIVALLGSRNGCIEDARNDVYRAGEDEGGVNTVDGGRAFATFCPVCEHTLT